MKQLINSLQKERSLKEKIKAQQQNQSLSQKFVSGFKGIDLYGEPIYLCLDGQSKYKTVIGATVSMFILMGLIIFFGVKIQDLITISNFSYSTTSQIRDIATTSYNLSLSDELAFTFATTIEITPEYGRIELVQSSYKTNGTTENVLYTEEKIPYSNCTSQFTHFIGLSNNFYCPIVNQTALIAGNDFQKENLKYITLKVFKCIAGSGTTCKNDSEIKEFFRKNKFNLAIKNSYLESNNFTDPIKYFLDDSFFWYFIPNQEQMAYLYLQVNDVVLTDDLVSSNSKKSQLYQVLRSQTASRDIDSKNGLMFNMQIRLENVKQTYNRKVYQVIDLLGDVGAMKTALFSIGFLLTSLVNRKLQYAAVIKRVYQLLDYKRINFRTRPRQSKTHQIVKTEDDNEISRVGKIKKFKSIDQMLKKYNKREGFSQNYGMFAKIRQLVSQALTKKRLKVEVGDFVKHAKDKLYVYIRNRKFLDYRTRDFLRYVCCFLFLRSQESLRKSEDLRKHYLFARGTKKLNYELDVVTLIKSIRQLELFSQVLLNENQRLVMRYQRANLIESGSSSSCDSDLDIVNLKKLGDQFLIKHFEDKLKGCLDHFATKSKRLSGVDERVLAGVIFRQVKADQLIKRKRTRKSSSKHKHKVKVEKKDDVEEEKQPDSQQTYSGLLSSRKFNINAI